MPGQRRGSAAPRLPVLFGEGTAGWPLMRRGIAPLNLDTDQRQVGRLSGRRATLLDRTDLREVRLGPRPETLPRYERWLSAFADTWAEENGIEGEHTPEQERRLWRAARDAWAETATRGDGPDLRERDLRAARAFRLSAPLADLRGARLAGGDFRGADLGGAGLQGTDLGGARLQGTDLGGARLGLANLRAARLQGADLRGARLQGANLWVAKLQGADLGRAKLELANLRAARLQGADLSRVSLKGADLTKARLQGAVL